MRFTLAAFGSTHRVDAQRFARNVSKPIKIAFDEYGVWDETVGES